MSLVDVVIVNWNSRTLLEECLDALLKSEPSLIASVIVVDNGSNEPVREVGDTEVPVSIKRNSSNLGFSRACNQGANFGSAEFILFLNPDTTVSRDALRKSVEVLRRDESIGVCGGRMEEMNGAPSTSYATFPSVKQFVAEALGLTFLLPNVFHCGRFAPDTRVSSHEVDQVIGAYFLVRRDLFRQLGGFDERYFVYYEEVDFSLRMKSAGYRSWYESSAVVTHVGGGCSSSVPATRLVYRTISRLLYSSVHFSLFAATVAFVCTLGLEPFSRLCKALVFGKWQDGVDVVRAYWWIYREVLLGICGFSSRMCGTEYDYRRF